MGIESIFKCDRRDVTATIIENKLYVSGGCSSSIFDRAVLSSTEVFELNELSCTTCNDHGKPDLKVARSEHASATIDDEIYFIGGRASQHTLLSSCEVINVATGESTELASLNQERCALSAVVFDGKIIVTGGFGADGALNSVECYSFDTKQWTMMPSMTKPRARHSNIIYKGQILVIGGLWGINCTISNDMEIYDPAIKQWTMSDYVISKQCHIVGAKSWWEIQQDSRIPKGITYGAVIIQ